MIPPFDSEGFLPSGVHAATVDEIRDRFGGPSEIRRAQMDSVLWMIDLARRAGVQRIVLNGSFVTDIMEPNDVDCVLLASPDPLPDPAAESELQDGLPFLDISLVRQKDFDFMIHRVFAADRRHRKKGMIEVIAWN
jgi:hypothetical protein